jgi:hypothetical protein
MSFFTALCSFSYPAPKPYTHIKIISQDAKGREDREREAVPKPTNKWGQEKG